MSTPAPTEDESTRLALHRSQARLADFAAAGSDGLWETDAALRFTWVSEGYAQASGLHSGALLGRVVDNPVLLDDEGLPLPAGRHLLELFQTGRHFSAALVERLYPSGRRFVAISARVHHDAQGRVAGWRGVASDVSALVQARQSARERSEVLRKIAAHVPGVIYQFRRDVDGLITIPYASPQLVGLLGLSPRSLVASAQAWFDRVHPEDVAGLQRSIDASAASLQFWRADYRVQWRGAGLRWLSGVATPERLADGSVLWHGFTSDVTEQRAQQQRMQYAEQQRVQAELQRQLADRQRQAAEQASRDKSLFLSRASHELRTPLNAVLGFTQLMLHDGGPALPPLQQQRVEQVQRAGEHLLSLINDLLDLGRADQAGAVQAAQPVPAVGLAPLLRQCLQQLQPLAAGMGLRTQVLLPAGALPVRADPRGLQQVLNNLLSNAIKYNRKGGRLRVQVRQRGQRLRLAVLDDGQGLSTAQRRRLFQPFDRLGAEDGTIPGSGLGLWIAQQLARTLGSRLRVCSPPGQGACFFFWLPLAAAADALAGADPAAAAAPATVPTSGFTAVAPGSAAAAAASDALAAASAAPERTPGALSGPVAALGLDAVVGERHCVLYIEDDPVNQLLVSEMLGACTRWHLVTACNGADGLALAALHRPAVVLTDMHLPGMSGLQVLQALRAAPQLAGTPCLALSAEALPEQVNQALGAGFDAYLTKPIDMRRLVQVLGDCLASQRPVASPPPPAAAGRRGAAVHRVTRGRSSAF